ncbi:hypothetical protein BH23ACT12_BH23ACT12_18220 [soil metagenome]
MKTAVVRVVSLCIFSALLLALAAPVLAHETRTEGGVQAVVGWATEPAYVGYPNAVQLRLSNTAGDPITTLGADDLQVEVSFGGQKTAALPLEPAFNSPGEYRAPLMPTRPGDYSFRFFGAVQGQRYDQTYQSGEETFDAPKNPADVSFPAKDPTVGELASRVEQLGDEADDGGSSDNTGMIGVGLGFLALIVALAALMKKSKAA